MARESLRSIPQGLLRTAILGGIGYLGYKLLFANVYSPKALLDPVKEKDRLSHNLVHQEHSNLRRALSAQKKIKRTKLSSDYNSKFQSQFKIGVDERIAASEKRIAELNQQIQKEHKQRLGR